MPYMARVTNMKYAPRLQVVVEKMKFSPLSLQLQKSEPIPMKPMLNNGKRLHILLKRKLQKSRRVIKEKKRRKKPKYNGNST